MKTIKTMLSSALSVAVVLALMIACLPFMQSAGGTMIGAFDTMAVSVWEGDGGEYADNMLSTLDNTSQKVVGELDKWSQETIAQCVAEAGEPIETQAEIDNIKACFMGFVADVENYITDLF